MEVQWIATNERDRLMDRTGSVRDDGHLEPDLGNNLGCLTAPWSPVSNPQI